MREPPIYILGTKNSDCDLACFEEAKYSIYN